MGESTPWTEDEDELCVQDSEDEFCTSDSDFDKSRFFFLGDETSKSIAEPEKNVRRNGENKEPVLKGSGASPAGFWMKPSEIIFLLLAGPGEKGE